MTSTHFMIAVRILDPLRKLSNIR